MGNDIERFQRHHRGQRIRGAPTLPLVDYPEFEGRRAPWIAAGQGAEALVATHGAATARAMLNKDVGFDLFIRNRRFVPELGAVANIGFLLLPGGCKWAIGTPRAGMEKAGCVFCEFQGIIDDVVGNLPIIEDEFTALVRAGMATFSGECWIVRLFTGGSGLNPGEIPIGTMQELARLVVRSPAVRVLGVESRVQYIVPDTLAIYQDILKPAGKSLEVMIGFETQDDALRNGPKLNKGMPRGMFEEAVSRLLEAEARPAAYVILMPVNDMTERGAVDECVQTINYLGECGVAEAMLQARYSHHPHIQCPKLWSIAHVLWETRDVGIPVTLGDWRGELPEPRVWPKNCGACDAGMIDVLQRWRETLDPSVVDPNNLPVCPNNCRAEWERELGLA